MTSQTSHQGSRTKTRSQSSEQYEDAHMFLFFFNTAMINYWWGRPPDSRLVSGVNNAEKNLIFCFRFFIADGDLLLYLILFYFRDFVAVMNWQSSAAELVKERRDILHTV